MTEQTQTSKTRTYIAYWDCLGFEAIVDVSKWERESLMNRIAGKELSPPPVNLKLLLLRAQANPQRFPEVWTFNTVDEFKQEDLWEIAKSEPQVLVDSIRNLGKCLYKSQKHENAVIK